VRHHDGGARALSIERNVVDGWLRFEIQKAYPKPMEKMGKKEA
jgi:hypothetical protein